MIIVMSTEATDQDIQTVVDALTHKGFGCNVSKGVERTIIGAIGIVDEQKAHVADALQRLPGVERVVPVSKPYKLVSIEHAEGQSTVEVDGIVFGGNAIHVMAGPCAVESREQIIDTATAVKAAGASMLRGGAFKPRTSPYDFQGLGRPGLEYLKEAKAETGLPIVTEVMDVRQVDVVAEHADMLQIGTRNMHNFDLLKEAGRTGMPVLLKRGFASTIDEWLQAAEYLASSGSLKIVLCERGIRTFSTATRSTLDISAVPVVKKMSHLPVAVDPSQAVGRWDLVAPMALAAVAAGADGLLVEVHPRPAEALSDSAQQLTFDSFAEMMKSVSAVASAVGRGVGAATPG